MALLTNAGLEVEALQHFRNARTNHPATTVLAFRAVRR